MKPTGKRILLGLVVLFVLLRLSILLTSDEITHTQEARQGNLAHYLHTGQKIRLGDFLHQSYEGSCLLDAVLVVGAYTVTGGSGHSLKLVTLIVSFLILLASLAVAREFPGKRSPHFFILLFTFAPTYFITWHFHTIGGSLYGSLYNVVVFLVALRIVREPTRLLYALWGVLCATGIYLNPSCLPGLAMSFLVVIIANRRILWNERMLYFGLAFVIPFVFYVQIFGLDVPAFKMVKGLFLTKDFQASRQLGYFVEDTGFGTKLVTLLGYDLRHSFYYKGLPWYGAVVYALMVGLFLISVAAAREGWGNMRDTLRGKTHATPALAPAAVNLYILFYFVLYLLADIAIFGPPVMIYYDQFYKYFYNVLPFVFLSAAFGLDRTLLRFPKQRVAIGVLLGLVTIPAVWCTFNLVSPTQLTLKSKFRAYNCKHQGRMLANRSRKNRHKRAVADCKQLDPRDALDCIQGVAMVCNLRPPTIPNVRKRAKRCCAEFPPQDRWLCVLGLGNRLTEAFFLHAGHMVEFCRTLGPGLADFCIQSYHSEIGDIPYREPERWLELLRFGTRDQRSQFLRNMGYWVYSYFLANPQWSFRTCRQVETRLQTSGCRELLSFHYGIREAAGGGAVDSGVLKLRETHRESFYEGFGFGRSWRLHPNKVKGLRACERLTEKSARAACVRGVTKFYALLHGHR
jgi:hypothetical protein